MNNKNSLKIVENKIKQLYIQACRDSGADYEEAVRQFHLTINRLQHEISVTRCKIDNDLSKFCYLS